MEEIDQADLEDLVRLAEYIKYNKIETYQPYAFQRKYHKEGHDHQYRFLMAGQQIGKSVANLCETTFHLTGLYPEWWEGHRFTSAIICWFGAQSNNKARDHIQTKLIGPVDDPDNEGTGWLPKHTIGKKTRRAGIPGAIDTIMVKHVTGSWSTLTFKTYEQKIEEWMGETVHYIPLDEEPPLAVYSQCVIRTLRNKGIISISATPESGMTDVVRMYMDDPRPGSFYMHASMDDAPHYSSEDIEKALASIPAHERDMRRRGLPIIGRGPVFQVSDDDIIIAPFQIPDHWVRICGIDFGHDHPFAAVWGAWDRDTDTFYVYDLYKEAKALPPTHAQAIRTRGKWIPVAWPHDGLNEEKGSGTALADLYRMNDVNLLQEKFSNPPGDNQKEGEGGNKVWPGLISMNEYMQSGRFKVFSHLSEWFKEKANYNVDEDGKLNRRNEDIMSASRYCFQSRRFGVTKADSIEKYTKRKPSYNWRVA